MLSLRQPELAEALEEVGQYGICKIAGALTPDARHELRMALEAFSLPTRRWNLRLVLTNLDGPGPDGVTGVHLCGPNPASPPAVALTGRFMPTAFAAFFL